MAGRAFSRLRRFPAAVFVSFAVTAAAAAQTSGDGRFESGGVLSQAALSVRQSGGAGNDNGLLSRLRGPAAVVDIEDSHGDTFRSLAGAMAGGPGGRQQGYVGGTGHAKVLGIGLTLNYAADEIGGSAVETRVEKPLGDVKLGLSQTWNHEFESAWTGYGDGRARHLSEASLDWAALPSLPLGFAVRETTHADGRQSTDFRTVQTLMLGSGGSMVVNSTSTEMLGLESGQSSGSLLYYGPLGGGVRLSAGFDYGGAYGMRPGVARLGAEKSFDRSWSVYGYGEKAIGTGVSRFDVGAVRDLGGFTLSTFAGAADDRSAYVGLRLSVPLSPDAKNDRWLGF